MEKLKSEIVDISYKISLAIQEGRIYEASNLRLLLNIKIDTLIKRKRNVDSALEKLSKRLDSKLD